MTQVVIQKLGMAIQRLQVAIQRPQDAIQTLHREPDLLCVTCRPNYEGFAIWLGHPIRVVQTQEHTYWAIRASGLDI